MSAQEMTMISKSIALYLLLAVGGGAMAAPKPAAENVAPAAQPEVSRPNCLRSTGSRIPPPDKGCISAPGQVLTHEDIDGTGTRDLGKAVSKLAPSAQLGGP
jgi:hypothetical protein